MRVSTLEDHCLRCLSQLARARGRMTIGKIAEREGLSVENTAKVLAKLREAGLIESFRGKDGGYVLSRDPEQISISDVLRSVGGDLFEFDRCHGAEGQDACVHETDCGIRPVWTILGELVHSFLSSISLADLVAEEPRVAEKLAQLRAAIERPASLRRSAPRGGAGLALRALAGSSDAGRESDGQRPS